MIKACHDGEGEVIKKKKNLHPFLTEKSASPAAGPTAGTVAEQPPSRIRLVGWCRTVLAELGECVGSELGKILP